MEVLYLDGKNYVKASKAARDLGYASDYVGQLCRGGKIRAHLVGRTWYVDPDELSSHRFEKKRMSRIKAREHAKKTIEEYRLKSQEKEPQKILRVRYEADSKELIPETRKLSVLSTGEKHYVEHIEESDETVIENKGEKVLMSGDLTVIDVTDAPIDPESTVLSPILNRKRREKELPVEKKSSIRSIRLKNTESEAGEAVSIISLASPETFVERLEEQKSSQGDKVGQNARVSQVDQTIGAIDPTLSDIKKVEEIISWRILVLVYVVLLVLMVGSLPSYLHIEYDSKNKEIFVHSYKYNVQKVLQKYGL